jgi:adenylyltransferase/sulfurtransferase
MFNPPATACLECLMPMTGPAPVDTCETLGVTPTVVGLVGTLAATEAAKRVLGLPTRILGRLLTIDLAGPDFVYTAIKRRENCGVCNGSSSEPVRSDNVVMLCGGRCC